MFSYIRDISYTRDVFVHSRYFVHSRCFRTFSIFSYIRSIFRSHAKFCGNTSKSTAWCCVCAALSHLLKVFSKAGEERRLFGSKKYAFGRNVGRGVRRTLSEVLPNLGVVVAPPMTTTTPNVFSTPHQYTRIPFSSAHSLVRRFYDDFFYIYGGGDRVNKRNAPPLSLGVLFVSSDQIRTRHTY